MLLGVACPPSSPLPPRTNVAKVGRGVYGGYGERNDPRRTRSKGNGVWLASLLLTMGSIVAQRERRVLDMSAMCDEREDHKVFACPGVLSCYRLISFNSSSDPSRVEAL